MILKLKAIIYRLTGVYLAKKEEAEHCATPEFKKQVKRMVDLNADISSKNAKSILIGLWQVSNGFIKSYVTVKKRLNKKTKR